MASKERILVVEDEHDFASILTALLEGKGYAVVTASNGEEGIKLFKREEPDLVLLDLHLPDMDGLEVCRHIRSNGPRRDTPVILCTVRSEVAPVAEGLKSGVDDYIVKPFDAKDLLERVAVALHAQR